MAKQRKLTLTIIGGLVTVASTIIGGFWLNSIDNQVRQATDQATTAANEYATHQRWADQSWTGQKQAEIIWALGGTSSVRDSNPLPVSITKPVADALYAAVSKMNIAAGGSESKNTDFSTQAESLNHSTLTISEQTAIFNKLETQINNLRAQYGNQFITQSQLKQKSYRNTLNALNARARLIQLFATMFQILGIIIALFREIESD